MAVGCSTTKVPSAVRTHRDPRAAKVEAYSVEHSSGVRTHVADPRAAKVEAYSVG
jgi:hypothetical protein